MPLSVFHGWREGGVPAFMTPGINISFEEREHYEDTPLPPALLPYTDMNFRSITPTASEGARSRALALHISWCVSSSLQSCSC